MSVTVQDGLLQAVLDEPDRDDVRLVYADWLEEQGDEDRAAFIRVQVELAERDRWVDPDGRTRHTAPPPGWETGRWDELRRREHSLLALHKTQWCEGINTYPGVSVVFRRGFVDEIRVPTLEAWCSGPCQACSGRGYLYGDGTSRPACESCGGVNARMDGEPRRLFPQKNGAGTTPGVGARVVRCAPVMRVRVANKRPAEFGKAGAWSWCNCGGGGEGCLPKDVSALLPAPKRVLEGVLTVYDSALAADLALSAALITLAKGTP